MDSGDGTPTTGLSDTRVVGRPAAVIREAVQPKAGLMITERMRLARPLASGGMATVWVAEHLTMHTEVAVKFVLANEDAALHERLAREGSLAARIEHPHAVRTFEQGSLSDGTPFVVMELLEGITLAERLETQGVLPPADVQRLVSQMAEALGEAHRQGIVHRDIKPHNIMLIAGAEALYAKVVDFGIAKPIGEEGISTLTNQGEVVGTPVYMAPEQLVDARPADEQADLWGLAVVAYEALTGQRPFQGPTRAAVGTAMVLQRYDPVTRLRPELPAALDGWFQRALHLNPAERFGSTGEFAEEFSKSAHGAPHRDANRQGVAGRLTISSRLYGRDSELNKAMTAFDQVSTGRPRLVLIRGFSGIGKTSLVRELHRRLLERSAVFAGGKFDQYDRGTPYEGVVRAFRALVRSVLARGDAELKLVREHVTEQLRGTGAALVEAIPELERLIGPQFPAPEVPPNEAKNRFHNALGALLRAVATENRPLVVFLDDLQWSDLASIELLARLLADPDSRHILFVGAYRDNEVSDTHPLTSAVADMRARGLPVDDIPLGALGEEAVLELVTDTLGKSPGRVRFSMECLRKTHGNPFFLKRFLESLHEKGMLHYNTEAAHWEWDAAAIAAQPIEDSVVEFVGAEIDRMEPLSGEALAIAACIGDHFDLGLLAGVLGVSRSRAIEGLAAGLTAELIVPGIEEGALPGATAGNNAGITFRFAHDRIRQAARLRLSDEEAAKIHGSVAGQMLRGLTRTQRHRRLFELVEHLNLGTDFDESVQAKTFRDLNLAAARRASGSAAFEAAHRYYGQACRYLADDPWSADYGQTLALHVEGAQAAYLAGDHAAMETLILAATGHATSAFDRARAMEVRIHAHVSQQGFAQALRVAGEALAELGVAIPEDPSPEDAQAAVGQTLAALAETNSEMIAGLKKADSADLALALRIETGIVSTAYLTAPNLLPILVGHIVRTTLDHGVFESSPYGFAVFALILNAGNLIDTSYETGKMAEKMLEVVNVRAVEPKTLHVLGTHVYPFIEPVIDNVPWGQRVYEQGMDTGDLEYAAWALHSMVCHGLYGGMNLSELSKLADRNVSVLDFHQQLPALGCTTPMQRLIRNLTAPSERPEMLVGDGYDESEHREELKATGFRGAVYVLTTAAVFARYIFGDLDGAIAVADQGAEFADGSVATHHPVLCTELRSLAVLGRVRAAASDEARAAVLDIAPHLQQLQTWSTFSSRNYAHRVHLIQAEVARLEEREADAMDLYARAIREASEGGFIHEAAMGNELAARFHADRNEETSATTHMDEARRLFEEWGATTKVEQLDRQRQQPR